jgi:hypothetical protein
MSRVPGAPKPVLPVSLPVLDGLDVETLVFLVPEDERPLQGALGLLDWRMCGWLSQQIQDGVVTGKRGEWVLTHPNGRVPAARLVLVGVGSKSDLQPQLAGVLTLLAERVVKAGCTKVVLGAPCSARALCEALAAAPAELQARVQGVFDPM